MKCRPGTETHPLHAHQVTYTLGIIERKINKATAATSDLFQDSANGFLLSHFLITVREFIGFQCNCRSKRQETVTHTCLKPSTHLCARDNPLWCELVLAFWLWQRQILFRWGLLKKGITVGFQYWKREGKKTPIINRALLLKALLTSPDHARIISKKSERQSSLTLQLCALSSTKIFHTSFMVNQPVKLYRQN